MAQHCCVILLNLIELENGFLVIQIKSIYQTFIIAIVHFLNLFYLSKWLVHVKYRYYFMTRALQLRMLFIQRIFLFFNQRFQLGSFKTFSFVFKFNSKYSSFFSTCQFETTTFKILNVITNIYLIWPKINIFKKINTIKIIFSMTYLYSTSVNFVLLLRSLCYFHNTLNTNLLKG